MSQQTSTTRPFVAAPGDGLLALVGAQQPDALKAGQAETNGWVCRWASWRCSSTFTASHRPVLLRARGQR